MLMILSVADAFLNELFSLRKFSLQFIIRKMVY